MENLRGAHALTSRIKVSAKAKTFVSSTKVLTLADTLIRELGAVAPRRVSIGWSGCGYLVNNCGGRPPDVDAGFAVGPIFNPNSQP